MMLQSGVNSLFSKYCTISCPGYQKHSLWACRSRLYSFCSGSNVMSWENSYCFLKSCDLMATDFTQTNDLDPITVSWRTNLLHTGYKSAFSLPQIHPLRSIPPTRRSSAGQPPPTPPPAPPRRKAARRPARPARRGPRRRCPAPATTRRARAATAATAAAARTTTAGPRRRSRRSR